MNEKDDIEVLRLCYDMIEKNIAAKKKKKAKATDKEIASGLFVGCTRLLIRLDNRSVPLTDIQNNVLKAKTFFYNFVALKTRNPSIITVSLDYAVEKLVREICFYEAEMIKSIRIQETHGEKLDIESILTSENGLLKMRTSLANVIIREAISGKVAESAQNQSISGFKYCITSTGRRYHLPNCIYCNNHKVIGISSEDIAKSGYSPCKCVITTNQKGIGNSVTVIVDESLKSIRTQNDVANFSYIVCKGNIHTEGHITKKTLITQGIDYVKESHHVEKITESAIGKVMYLLAYEYSFSGKLRIFVDNKTRVRKWREDARNKKLTELFEHVEVCYIPRELNRKADKLLREQFLVNVSQNEYNEIKKKCEMYDAWKQERELLKSELANEMLNTLTDMSNISDRNYRENRILYMVFKMADSMLDRFVD